MAPTPIPTMTHSAAQTAVPQICLITCSLPRSRPAEPFNAFTSRTLHNDNGTTTTNVNATYTSAFAHNTFWRRGVARNDVRMVPKRNSVVTPSTAMIIRMTTPKKFTPIRYTDAALLWSNDPSVAAPSG